MQALLWLIPPSTPLLTTGLILSRANLVLRRAGRPVRSKNSHLPVISAKARMGGTTPCGEWKTCCL